MSDSREIMAQLRRKMNRAVRSVARDALASAMELTPVDTGEARGNWHVAVEDDPPDHDPKRRPAAARAEGRVAASQFGIGKRAMVANVAPYAALLEFGDGDRPGAAMVRRTAAKVPGFVKAAVAREKGR